MMNYKEFKERMIEVVNGAFVESGYSLVETEPALLANEEKREAYMLCRATREKNKPIPVIQPETLYKAFINSDKSFEETMEQLVTSLAQSVLETNEQQVDLNKLSDLNYVQDHIFVRVLNMDKNRELLKDVPHRVWNDLAVFCELVVMENPDGSFGTIKISDAILKALGLSEDEMFNMAYANTGKDGFTVSPIETLHPLLALLTCEEVPMLVCTNEKGCKGANFILFDEQLKTISERLGGDFIILPSSIHEVICVPDSDEDHLFVEMVREVNQTAVEPHEVLSDTSYRYIAAENKVVIMDME